MKSNVSATAMMTMTNSSVPLIALRLTVLHNYVLQGVGDVLAAIHRLFEVLVNLFQLEHGQRVAPAAKQRADRGAVHLVGFVFQSVDLDTVVQQRLVVAQRGE